MIYARLFVAPRLDASGDRLEGPSNIPEATHWSWKY